nr:PREDICTED: IGF-like family receptor 1 [Latimeria chalumnae]|eukprot:XP_005999234.1 PREDICTED: IGF-like family receptor 1 [Latimeria chalumnae]
MQKVCKFTKDKNTLNAVVTLDNGEKEVLQPQGNGICRSLPCHSWEKATELTAPNDRNETWVNSLQNLPLHKVLDSIDILEELIMLLDPEPLNSKSSRHVAAKYGLPSAWITYAYSMKEHRSPLKAVLEHVTAKNPDSTVGELLDVLTAIGRNDARLVLKKLAAEAPAAPWEADSLMAMSAGVWSPLLGNLFKDSDKLPVETRENSLF